MTSNDDEEHKKCKGVKYSAIRQQLTLAKYKHVLFNRQIEKVSQNLIRSYRHQLYTEKVDKIGLSFNDDKAFVMDNNIHTLTLGHRRIKEMLKNKM